MENTIFNAVRCLECGCEMEVCLFPEQCPQCGSQWLDAVYDYQQVPDNWPSLVSSRPTNMWRYRELLPLPPDLDLVSMGEGWTPLLPAKALEQKYNKDVLLWVKDERRQPTGSFKDRQAAVTISALKTQGITELALASTGNAAAAYAAYCARAGIKLWVFLPSSVPAEKMRELALYGAEIVKTTGTYDQAKEIASDFAHRRNIIFDRGAKAILGKESFKTIAFEIAEQLGWRAPDWYLQAVSGGIGPLGILKGFKELYDLGFVDRIPKLGLIQIEGCAPMAHAYEQGRLNAESIEPETLITVLSTGNPGYSYRLLKQIIDTNGGAVASVSDGEAFRAMRRVARLEGLSMEPASSVAFAGLEKLIALGYISPDTTVVVNCSGHTFSAEKHALEDRYYLQLETPTRKGKQHVFEGIETALEQLDEQVTTIVVIDDNPDDSRILRRFFQQYKKYRVFEAHHGLDGIDLVQQRKPDLVVLDLTLPDMDGFSILNQLKKDARTQNIPVIVVSARVLSKDEWQQLRKQTESVWEKGTFRPRELVGHVVDMLGDSLEITAVQPENDSESSLEQR